MERPIKPSNIRAGIALAFATFVISIFLYFQPQYFGLMTNAVAIALIVFGVAGLGIELEKLTSGKQDALIPPEKGAGIFDNLGIGLALLIIWVALYHYFPIVWVNILISFVLLFAVYAIALGFTNFLFRTLSPKDVSSQSELAGSPSRDSNGSSQAKVSKPWSFAVKTAMVIAGVTGFVASLLQALQILKIIP
jgi:hypothetical protein